MPFEERRSVPRTNLRIPLRFRSVQTATPGTLTAETVNLSQRGVFFTTDHPINVGTPLELFLTMPREVTGKNPTEVRCTARVIHIQHDVARSGKAGVGACIERYEPAAAHAPWRG